MGFRSDGFIVFENGLTGAGFDELSRLSRLHEAEATPTIAGRSWGECQLDHIEHLPAMDIVTSGLRQAIEEIGFGKPWPVLALDFARPHLTYSFQTGTGVSGLALNQHTDGLWPPTADHVAQSEFLMGVLLGPVSSFDCGPYVFWPNSHLDAIDHLDRSPESVLADRFRTIPPGAGRPTPFLGHAGDVIVVHRLLRHGTAARTSPGVRRMAFFRLGHEFLAARARVGDTSFTRL
jgi:hypothetical protein